MKVDEALSLLGLSSGPHKPIEIDKAYLKPRGRGGRASQAPSAQQQDPISDVIQANPYPISDAIEIWDTLVFGWEYLSEAEVSNLSVRELCAIRAQRLQENRGDEFSALIDSEFPNRMQYRWDSQNAFNAVGSLLELEHLKAAASRDLVSDTIVRAQIARARFRALYINPTMLWIEGTYLESKEGKRLYSNWMDELYKPEISDRDYFYYFEEGAGRDYYRLRFPIEIEERLFKISNMYGQCGIVNALRLIVLHAGIGFDDYGRILQSSINTLELSRDDVCNIADSIIRCQIGRPRLPFGDAYDVRASIGNQRCASACMLPKRQREQLLGNGSVLQERFADEEGLRTALAELCIKARRSLFGGSREEAQRKIINNILRAICELDGVAPDGLGISKEALTPSGEAHDCLMHEPASMVPNGTIGERAMIIEAFDDYRRSQKAHAGVYGQWRFRLQYNKAFDSIKSALGNLFGGALLAFLFLWLPEALIIAIFTDGNIDLFGDQYFYIVAATAIGVGLFAAVWEWLSWPINVRWDRRLKRVPKRIRWALSLQALGSSLVMAAIGACVGCIAFAMLSSLTGNYALASTECMRIASIVSGVAVFLIALVFHHPDDWRSVFDRKHAEDDAVRSEWEEQIAKHVRSEFPTLEVETNNRTIIRSRDRFFGHYEIDIWIPEIKLGIEANGEQYHDHEAYDRDVRNGTQNSREMYKEKFCAGKGIKLVHVWSSDSMEQIFDTVDYEIQKRIA